MSSNEPLHETIQRLDTAIRDLRHSVEALTESTKHRDKDLLSSISALTESTKLQIDIMRVDYKLLRADLQEIDEKTSTKASQDSVDLLRADLQKDVRKRASQDSLDMLRTELNNKLDVILKAVTPFHSDSLQQIRFEE